MFTANSMNCLTEAIGLSLPGNGSVLATHTARKALYEDAGRTVVDITRRYYEQDDETVLPRNIATRAAFENAMALDIAMGGSTNTILHLLAAAQEAGRRLRPRRDQRGLAPGAVPGEGRARTSPRTARTTWRTCTGPAASPPSSASCTAPGLLNEDVHTRPQPRRWRTG